MLYTPRNTIDQSIRLFQLVVMNDDLSINNNKRNHNFVWIKPFTFILMLFVAQIKIIWYFSPLFAPYLYEIGDGHLWNSLPNTNEKSIHISSELKNTVKRLKSVFALKSTRFTGSSANNSLACCCYIVYAYKMLYCIFSLTFLHVRHTTLMLLLVFLFFFLFIVHAIVLYSLVSILTWDFLRLISASASRIFNMHAVSSCFGWSGN